jgi:Fe-S cluster assembly protein SufD
MNTKSYIKERFEQLKGDQPSSGLDTIRESGYSAFNQMGIPTVKHEEWKYTRISPLFDKEFLFGKAIQKGISAAEFKPLRLPGAEEANELVFVNGIFTPALSVVRSGELVVLPLEEAANNEYAKVVRDNLGHSARYLNDGLNAMNTALLEGGIFIHIPKGKIASHPVYIYNISDASESNVLAQPRSLIHVGENAQIQLVETYKTLGLAEALVNQVMEVVVEKDAMVEYYKIQHDSCQSNQVSTTHFRQVGKSYVHSVVITLKGGIIRNNLNIVMEAEYCESHLYGLYFPTGKTHVDNHTVVDNVKPHYLSNELYKGILDGQSSGVFNGKIFVQPQAQKINAYQSNKNILLSDTASVNTKPQLEIFADDVKCSHGCTVGRLNDEGLFYLRSRGISEKTAKSLLVQAFAVDILEYIKPQPIRDYVDRLISERLEFDKL